VYANAEVPLATQPRLAGVQAHPHVDLDALRPTMLRQFPLRLDRCGDRIFRTSKRDE
jgi:hypothetical protein